MSDLVLKRARVITLDEKHPCYEDASLVVKERRVAWLGEGKAPSEFDGLPECDAQGRVVTPGLVNAHTHLYSALSRGASPRGEPPANFRETLERLWWRLDKALTEEDILAGSRVGLIECLRGGVTTVLDHHSSPYAIAGSLDLVARAFRETGLRGSLCYEVSDRDGPECRRAGIGENLRWLKSCRQDEGGMLHGHFGLHASFTLKDDSLDECREALTGMREVGFHLHVAEDRCDRGHSLALDERGVVHRLHRLGVLGERTIAAHAIHLSDEELQLLRDTRTSVAHNPQSNMNNAVGTARVLQMVSQGVRVGVGSDGMTGAILQEVKAALLLVRHASGDPRVGWRELPVLFEVNQQAIAAAAGHRGAGRLAAGGPADWVLWDYLPPTPLSPETLWGHLVFGLAAARPQAVMVAGRWRMREGRLVDLDEEKIMAQARERAAKLWERM